MATLIKAPVAYPLPRSEDGRFNSWASDVSEEEEDGFGDYL
ncbi:hypothetical protein ACFFJ4_23000 [Xanthomonas dyei]|nr:hypothetical protein [Xanthomonas dyei]